jgi:hypothetical protein
MPFDPIALFNDGHKQLAGGEWGVSGSNLELRSYIASGGVTLPDVEFLATAELFIPDERVVLQVHRLSGPGPLRPLARICWRPKTGHENRKVGPHRLHLKEFPGSHIHRLEDNYIALEERMRSENLPVADELPWEPQSYLELLVLAAEEFRIMNLTQLPLPPWEPLLRME